MTEPPIPTFAVVGLPSEGKTTLIATLAEDTRAEIGPRPHTTRRRKEYSVLLGNQVAIRFFDTPGFENPGQVMSRLRHLREGGLTERAAIAAFYNEAVLKREFDYERELLEPLLRHDASAIVVVDASNGFDETLEPMMEILSWTCQPRAVIVNYHAEDDGIADEMVNRAQRWTGFVRTIDAATATWRERFDLLQDLLLSLRRPNDDRARIETTLKALEDRWKARRACVVATITELLVSSVRLTLKERSPADCDHKEAKRKSAERFREELCRSEREVHLRILAEYRHETVSLTYQAELAFDDLFSKETVRVFGLSRHQLVAASAAAGAAIGFAVDALPGGLLLGIPTAVGATVGGACGFLAQWRIPIRMRWLPVPHRARSVPWLSNIGTKPLREIEICTGPVKARDFPVALLRRAAYVYDYAVRTPHGNRNDGLGAAISEKGYREVTENEKRVMNLCLVLQKSASGKKADDAKRQLEEHVRQACPEETEEGGQSMRGRHPSNLRNST